MIGFMTSGSVEYFQISDVLALMFDNSAQPSINGLQPNHMDGSLPQMAFPATAQKINAHPRRNKKPYTEPQLKKAHTALRYVAD